jgi:hypothetical protein
MGAPNGFLPFFLSSEDLRAEAAGHGAPLLPRLPEVRVVLLLEFPHHPRSWLPATWRWSSPFRFSPLQPACTASRTSLRNACFDQDADKADRRFPATWPNPTLLSSMHVKHRVTGLNVTPGCSACRRSATGSGWATLCSSPYASGTPTTTASHPPARASVVAPDWTSVPCCSASDPVRVVF